MSREDDDKSKQEPSAKPVAAQPVKVIHEKTKFFRGKWSSKQNPSEVESVRLCVNGEWLQWQRGVTCIVPEPYLLSANNCNIVKYTQEPGKGRKVQSVINRFTFERDGSRPEATYEEFRKSLTEGNQKTKEAVAMHGINIPVEQAVPQIQI